MNLLVYPLRCGCVCSSRRLPTLLLQRALHQKAKTPSQQQEHSNNVNYTDSLYQDVSFQSLEIKPTLCKALMNEGIHIPTIVQYEALPITLARKNHCIIHSETGTGKTLTFLLPALQEQLPGLTSLIVVPTRELAVQIQHQASKLVGQGKNVKRVLAMYSGVDDKEMISSYLKRKPHVIIATPKRLLELLQKNLNDFVNLRRLVLDEVDKLLLVPLKKKGDYKKRFIREIHPRPTTIIMEKLLSLRTRYRPQLIASSATIDNELKQELIKLGWGYKVEMISTTRSHSELVIPETIEHCYLPCPDNTENESNPKDHSTVTVDEYSKINVLLDHFKSSDEKSALVFIHRGAPISRFLYDLRSRGIKAVALHENITSPEQYSEFVDDFKSGENQLVVATEETVRGLDFTWLNTVYLMVVPQTAREYLHLCGRVGRVGQSGRAIVIVEGSIEPRRLETLYRKLKVKGNLIVCR